MLADNGYASKPEVEQAEAMGVESYLATGAAGRRLLHDLRPTSTSKPREPNADWQ